MTSALSSSLHEALLTMAMYTSSERGRAAVPLITSNATISPFPMSIVVKVGGVEVP
jgi:autophagy-related protein 101